MPLAIGKVTINVDLCGSIPRSQLMPSTTTEQQAPLISIPSGTQVSEERGAQASHQKLVELTSSDLNTLHRISTLHTNNKIDTTKLAPPILESRPAPMRHAPSSALVDAPDWAVPAKGQARLEPVCETVGTHPVIDLTSRSSYRIGRSPASDVQLWHETSSRRHAMLFHHPNGSCYVVDCGSAHGTYVNGKRVRSTLVGSNNIIPHRVRRGAMIRFGGPGAPAFVLKSFSAGMSAKVVNLITADTENEKQKVQLNTRLNSVGPSSTTGILRKRHYVPVVESEDDSSFGSISNKRQRLCSSPPPESMQEERVPLTAIRLVSPDNVPKPTITDRLPALADILQEQPSRRVTFSDYSQTFYPALVTPGEISSDDETLV